MINNMKLGESEAIALSATVISTKIFLTLPAVISDLVGCSGWMTILASGLLTTIFFLFILKYINRFPDKTFPETAAEIVGPYIGVFLSLLILITWVVKISFTLRIFSEAMIINALPHTPLSIIVAVFTIVAVIVSYMGINTIAQACYITFPVSLGAILVICIMTFHLWETDRMFPLLGNGLWPVLKYSLLRTSDFIELNILYIFPIFFHQKQLKRIGYKSIAVSTMIFFVVVLTNTLSFPTEVSREMYLPLYMMARNIYLGRFLQRIEGIFMVFWLISGCLWISAGLFGASALLASILKLPEYQPLILPLAIISYSISFIPQNLPDLVLLISYYIRNTLFIITFGIPLILLVIAHFRKKGVNSNTNT
ncbi:MAG: endospore germination permease [Thermoanaerobacteraceae bacterium]|nr:endospore germination permease [Thermoanaerobacteraceae bacterium]